MSIAATRTDVSTLVVHTAGINCDEETVRAFERAGAKAELLHLAKLIAEPARLDDHRVLVIPGGFSYGDYVAAGRIYGSELVTHLADALSTFVARGGFVLGICNGFQVLLETGLMTPDASEKELALYGNASDRFECRWVHLRSERCACPWIEEGELLPVPVAHAEGRFVVKDRATLERLRANGQVALRYVPAPGSEAGKDGAGYPANPNGAIDDIAGICDPTGRVLGLMPHPERNLDPWQHPLAARMGERTEGEGLGFFRRIVETAADA